MITAIEANHPNLTNQEMLYVEISRARDRAELVTDDKATLKEQLEALTGEQIAALEALGDGKAKGPEVTREADMKGGDDRNEGGSPKPDPGAEVGRPRLGAVTESRSHTYLQDAI